MFRLQVRRFDLKSFRVSLTLKNADRPKLRRSGLGRKRGLVPPIKTKQAPPQRSQFPPLLRD